MLEILRGGTESARGREYDKERNTPGLPYELKEAPDKIGKQAGYVPVKAKLLKHMLAKNKESLKGREIYFREN